MKFLIYYYKVTGNLIISITIKYIIDVELKS